MITSGPARADARCPRSTDQREVEMWLSTRVTRTLLLAATTVALALCIRLDPAMADDWDAAKAQAQCASFTTYGMAEDGVYGPWFQAMYQHYGWTNCKRTDNDLGSSEVVAAYEAEKNNPKGVIADIGIVFGPEAEQRGLLRPLGRHRGDEGQGRQGGVHHSFGWQHLGALGPAA